jgi:hypothetical protein
MELNSASDTLLIAFAGINGALGIFPFEFFNITKGFNINKIFIRDFGQSWHHTGMIDVSCNIEGTARYLQDFIKKQGYKKVVCLGNSMGGYAAIVIGTLINADCVHAFAPQTFLDGENRNKFNDNRWPEQISNIPATTDKKYLDLAVFFKDYRGRCEINIYYSSDERIDIVHAQHLTNCHNIILHCYGHGGHLLVQFLKKTGELYRILRNSLTNFSGDRVVSVFKEVEAGITVPNACKRHEVNLDIYTEWHEKYNTSQLLQAKLLMQFFAGLENYLSKNNFLCVNDKIDKIHLYNEKYCIEWFGSNKIRKQLFGSFFYFGNERYLLHVEVGTTNLHIGIVKYAPLNETYKIIAMNSEECDEIVLACNGKLPSPIKLEARNWGHKWCSIDCGEFIDLSRHDVFRAVSDFENSGLLTDKFLPFLSILI